MVEVENKSDSDDGSRLSRDKVSSSAQTFRQSHVHELPCMVIHALVTHQDPSLISKSVQSCYKPYHAQ